MYQEIKWMNLEVKEIKRQWMGGKGGRGAEDTLQPCQNQMNTTFCAVTSFSAEVTKQLSARWPQKVKPKWELQGEPVGCFLCQKEVKTSGGQAKSRFRWQWLCVSK